MTAIVPPEVQVQEHCHAGPSLEIDIATFQEKDGPSGAPRNGPPEHTKTLTAWSPPPALYAMPAVFTDSYEVRVFSTMGGLTLVAVIEFISPGNKDRADARRAFAAKCAGC